jgi:hypothetical protein
MSDYGSDAEDETEFTCANVRPPPPPIAAFSISSLSELVERGALTSKVLRTRRFEGRAVLIHAPIAVRTSHRV